MRCGRCNGLMIQETQNEVTISNSIVLFQAFRCLNCGDVIDSEILENRERDRKERLSLFAHHLTAVLLLKLKEQTFYRRIWAERKELALTMTGDDR